MNWVFGLFVTAVVVVSGAGASCNYTYVRVADGAHLDSALSNVKPGMFIALDRNSKFEFSRFFVMKGASGEEDCPIVIASDPEQSHLEPAVVLNRELVIQKSSYVTLANLTFEKSKGYTGLCVSVGGNSSHIVLENINFTGEFGGALDICNSSVVSVRNCIFNCLHFPAIVEDSEDVSFEKCTFDINSTFFFHVHDSIRTTISECDFLETASVIMGIMLERANKTSVVKNRFFNHFGLSDIFALTSQDYVIQANSFVIPKGSVAVKNQESEGTLCISNKVTGGGRLVLPSTPIDDSC